MSRKLEWVSVITEWCAGRYIIRERGENVFELDEGTQMLKTCKSLAEAQALAEVVNRHRQERQSFEEEWKGGSYC